MSARPARGHLACERVDLRRELLVQVPHVQHLRGLRCDVVAQARELGHLGGCENQMGKPGVCSRGVGGASGRCDLWSAELRARWECRGGG